MIPHLFYPAGKVHKIKNRHVKRPTRRKIIGGKEYWRCCGCGVYRRPSSYWPNRSRKDPRDRCKYCADSRYTSKRHLGLELPFYLLDNGQVIDHLQITYGISYNTVKKVKDGDSDE